MHSVNGGESDTGLKNPALNSQDFQVISRIDPPSEIANVDASLPEHSPTLACLDSSVNPVTPQKVVHDVDNTPSRSAD